MRPQVTSSAGNTPFLWKVDGLSVSASLSREVLNALRERLLRGGSPPEEFGGILLGGFEGEEGFYQSRIEGFELFTVEHRFGPSFSLSLRDQKRLRQRLERLEHGRNRPIGFFRAHLRRGLYLDQRDFDLFQSEFRHPASVFLLLRIEETQPASVKAGLFVWEGEDMRRHASYLEFPVEGDGAEVPVHAAPAPALIAPALVIPAAAPPVERPAPAPQVSLEATRPRVNGYAPAVQAGQELHLPNVRSAAEPPAAPKWSLPRLNLPRMDAAKLRPAAMVFLAIGLPLGAFFIGREVGLREQVPAESARSNVASAEEPASAPEVRATPPAPVSEPAAQDPAQSFVPPTPDEGGDSPAANPPNYRERSAARAASTPPRIWHASRTTPEAPPPALPEPPTITEKASLPQFPKLPVSASASPQPTRVVAYIKPAPQSSLKQVLRALRLSGGKTEAFTPANPLEHPMPAAAKPLAADADKTVELAAKIDATGNVVNVKVLQGSTQLADTSANALYRWRFEPARQNGAPVDSEMLVRFEFSNSTRRP